MEINYSEKNALITGASSGIGRDIAYLMAEKGINLALLARRNDVLTEIKEDLESKHSIKVMVISADLSQVSEYEKIYSTCKNNDFMPDFLVNNAGYGTLDSFHKIPYEDVKYFYRRPLADYELKGKFVSPSDAFGRIVVDESPK